MRLGVYDDSLLLLGARLVAAGRLPYRDFYTHYGPLGYTLLAALMRWIANPGITLRLAQAVSLAVVAALLAVAVWRARARPTAIAATGAVLALSAALAQSSFIGLALAAAAVTVYVAGRETAGALRVLELVVAGVLLAATAWTRPAFAAYAGASLVWLELAAGTRASRRGLVLVLTAALASAVLLWIVFYRHLSPATVAEATLLAPARLMTLGKRILLPDFARAGVAISLLAAGAVAAAPMAWAWPIASRRGRLWSAAAIGLGAVLPLGLGPGREWLTVVLTLLSLVANAGLALFCRESLRDSPCLRAAAALGLSASAFGHYFWSRPDPQHLFPLLALASASVLFVWDRYGLPARLAVIGVFVLAFVPIGPGREAPLPVISLWTGGLARMRESSARPGASFRTVWPAGEVPSHAAAAVSLADRLSSTSSRFVAYGSDQVWTAGDPVYLFLLSSRLPYTKWFQYDPGLQSSPPVQAEMIGELAAAKSQAAVVWRSEAYAYDQRAAGLPERSPFDLEADRLYSRVIARFGNLEVRALADTVPPSVPEAGPR